MPRPTRQRLTPTKNGARRDDLIDKLIRLFLAEGFSDLSIEDLARRLRCSKSTLYNVAGSKEQIIAVVVRAFFRGATARVDTALAADRGDALSRIRTYLTAISTELAPATPDFFADLDSTPAALDIYRANTHAAARRVQDLVLESNAGRSRSDARFVGAVAAQIMEAIHRGEIETSTQLDDSSAYRALADLIVAALDGSGSAKDVHERTRRRGPS
jgi:AcrR family transcriptional regulator